MAFFQTRREHRSQSFTPRPSGNGPRPCALSMCDVSAWIVLVDLGHGQKGQVIVAGARMSAEPGTLLREALGRAGYGRVRTGTVAHLNGFGMSTRATEQHDREVC